MTPGDIATACVAVGIIVFFICDVAHDYLRSKYGEHGELKESDDA